MKINYIINSHFQNKSFVTRDVCNYRITFPESGSYDGDTITIKFLKESSSTDIKFGVGTSITSMNFNSYNVGDSISIKKPDNAYISVYATSIIQGQFTIEYQYFQTGNKSAPKTSSSGSSSSGSKNSDENIERISEINQDNETISESDRLVIIICCAIMGLVLIGGLIFYFVRRNKKQFEKAKLYSVQVQNQSEVQEVSQVHQFHNHISLFNFFINHRDQRNFETIIQQVFKPITPSHNFYDINTFQPITTQHINQNDDIQFIPHTMSDLDSISIRPPTNLINNLKIIQFNAALQFLINFKQLTINTLNNQKQFSQNNPIMNNNNYQQPIFQHQSFHQFNNLPSHERMNSTQGLLLPSIKQTQTNDYRYEDQNEINLDKINNYDLIRNYDTQQPKQNFDNNFIQKSQDIGHLSLPNNQKAFEQLPMINPIQPYDDKLMTQRIYNNSLSLGIGDKTYIMNQGQIPIQNRNPKTSRIDLLPQLQINNIQKNF